MMRSSSGLLPLLVTLVLVVGLAALLTRDLWLPGLGRFLVVADPLQIADAIVPLAGEQSRPAAAAELQQMGYATSLLVTSVPLDTEQERDWYRAQVIAIVTGLGVSEDDILVVPDVGETTYAEALTVRDVVLSAGFESLIVVTSPWHTRRARIIFGGVFRRTGVTVIVRPVGAEFYDGSPYRADVWWTSPSGRHLTRSEYFKLAAHVMGVR